jgi:glucose-1-phosphate thymidylyltransferase
LRAVILAAGYATRLYPLTLETPKPLLEVAGRPILDHLLERITPIGLDSIHVVTNSKFAPQFREWAAGRSETEVVDDGTTSDETKLGAIGDLHLLLERGLEDDLVVAAGDSLFSESLEGFGEAAREREAPQIAVYDIGDPEAIKRYSSVIVDDEGRVTAFEEKPERPRSTLNGVALYFYPRHVLPLVRRYVEEGNNPDQPGRLVEWMHTRTPVYAWEVPGEWFDIGSPETLERARRVYGAKS